MITDATTTRRSIDRAYKVKHRSNMSTVHAHSKGNGGYHNDPRVCGEVVLRRRPIVKTIMVHEDVKRLNARTAVARKSLSEASELRTNTHRFRLGRREINHVATGIPAPNRQLKSKSHTLSVLKVSTALLHAIGAPKSVRSVTVNDTNDQIAPQERTAMSDQRLVDVESVLKSRDLSKRHRRV